MTTYDESGSSKKQLDDYRMGKDSNPNLNYPEVLPLDEIVERLGQADLSPETIASVIQTPIAYVHGILTRVKTTGKSDNDDLIKDLRLLVRLAIKRAFFWMDLGTPDTQIALIKTVLSPTITRLLSSEQLEDNETMRSEFEALLLEMRTSDTVTDQDIIDVEPISTPETTNHQA